MASLKSWLSDRIGAYRDLPHYLRGIRKAGLEIAYGESLLALAFAGYTYVNAISFYSVLAFFGGSFVLAGYHIWRADYLRLVPKLGWQKPIFTLHPATTADPANQRTLYLQLLPCCLTNAPVSGCEGRLLRVLKWNNVNGWSPTELNQPLNLKWSFYGAIPLTLHPGIEQRLNVCFLTNQHDRILLETEPVPMAAFALLTLEGQFRFDIRITASDCPPIDLSLFVQVGSRWDTPTVKQIY